MVEPAPQPSPAAVPFFDNEMKGQMKKLAFQIAEAEIKDKLGITIKPDRELYKSRAGRFVYQLRDLWHGVWWTIPLFVFGMLITVVLFLWMRKVLGV